VVATLEDLDEPALGRILAERKNALVKQYRRLFEMESIELSFAEAILPDTMFDLPSLEGIEEAVVSKQVVEGAALPLYIYSENAERTVDT
jgi:ATP-dependent Clp protease ATP-binding subunit ClpX